MGRGIQIIIDVEATCTDSDEFPSGEMEVIEIGAVATDLQGVQGEFQTFVKPVRNPILTEFCKELTGISQEEVDSGLAYSNAFTDLCSWMLSYGQQGFASWGKYDWSQFKRDCEYHHIEFAISADHINLTEEFKRQLHLPRTCGLGRALDLIGIDFEGEKHRGLDDARNIAKIYRWLESAKYGHH